jgi:acetyl-CoA synthetase/4-hydroxybutyrate---CoA ligase (AMP-forming)
LSGKIRRVELREREVERQESDGDAPDLEFYYWDFPELSSKKN